jgi:cation/acetate symporter
MSFGDGDPRALGKGFGLLAVAFALFTGVLSLLSVIGLPGQLASVLLAVVALSTFVVLGFATRTMQLPDFQVASRRVPPVLNGMATAAAFIASAGFLGLAGAFFAGNRAAAAVVVGWAIGFLALAVLVAPYLRKAAAISVADFLAIRFGSRAVRLAAALVTIACSAGFLVAEIAVAGEIAAMLLPIGAETAIVLVVVVLLAGSLLGGMGAVTMTAAAQYVVLAIAFLTPVTILSLQELDFPLPQLSYGFALREIDGLGGPVAVDAANRFLPLPPMDGFNMAVLAVSLAAGVAALPHIAMRSTTATGVGAARRSAGWALFFVLPIMVTAPAYGAFAQLALLGSASPARLDAALVVLNLPRIAELLPAISALVATGALAAILAAATALLFAIANTVGHDLYGGIVDRKGPAGRKLIVTRVALIAVAGLAGWHAASAGDGIFALAATSASLAASGLFPALVLGIWWKRATAAGAFAGIALGFVAGAAYVWMVLSGEMAPWQPLGTAGPALPPMAAAFFGLPVGILAIMLVSYLTPAPTPERMEGIEAIRRPTPGPQFDR